MSKDEMTDREREAILKAAAEARSAGLNPVYELYRMADSEALLRKAIADRRAKTAEPSKSRHLNTLSFPYWAAFPLTDADDFWTFWNGIETFLRGTYPALGFDIVFSPTFQEAVCRLRQMCARDPGGRRLAAAEHYKDPQSPNAIRIALDAFRVIDRTSRADRELFEKKLDGIAKAIALKPLGKGNPPLKVSDEERQYYRHLYRRALENLLRAADENTPLNFSEEDELLREVVRVLPLSGFPDYQRTEHAPGLARHLARLRNPKRGEKRNYLLRSAVWLLEDLQRLEGTPPRVVGDAEARRTAKAIAVAWKRHTLREPHRSRFLERNSSDEPEFK